MGSQVFTHDMLPLPLSDSEHVSDRLEQMFQTIENELAMRLSPPIKEANEMMASVIGMDGEKRDSK